MTVTRPEIGRALRLSEGVSLISSRRRAALFRLAAGLEQDGDVVEAGTFRGGSAVVLATALRDRPDRTLHLFDRWGDVPAPTQEDGRQVAEYDARRRAELVVKHRDALSRCRHLVLEEAGIPAEHVTFNQGWFHETFPRYAGAPIAMAHLDSDFYEPMALSLRFVEEHAAPVCVIAIDDYDTFDGARQAVDEFRRERGLALEDAGGVPVLHLRS
jgi:O-methyltransferase